MTGRYLEALRRRAAWLVALAVFGAAIGYLLSTAATPRYRATSQLYVTAAARVELIPTTGSRFAEITAQSLAAAVDSPAVLRRATRRYGLALSPRTLAAEVSAEAPAGKVLINVSVTNTEAPRAARLANAVSRAFIAVADGSSVGHKVVVVRRAVAPDDPVGANVVAFVGGGCLVGLLTGLLVVPALSSRRSGSKER